MEYRPFPDERSDEFDAFMRYAFSPPRARTTPRRPTTTTPSPTRGACSTPTTTRSRSARTTLSRCGSAAPTARSPGSPRSRPAGTSPAGERRPHAPGVADGVPRPGRLRLDAVALRMPSTPATAGRPRAAIATSPRPRSARVRRRPDRDRGRRRRSFRPLDEDDYAAVKPVIAAMADRYDLTMDWTEEWWRERAPRMEDRPVRLRLGARRGPPRICAYSFDDDADDADETVMRVTDVAAADDEAWFQLLRFVRNHDDSQVAEVRIQAPPDAPLLDLVEDPAPSTARSEPGRWSGSSMPPPPRSLDPRSGDPETAFSLSVSDPLVDWNDETFRVAVADGTVAVEPTVDGEVDKSEVDGAEAADAAIDIGTLAAAVRRLHVGRRGGPERRARSRFRARRRFARCSRRGRRTFARGSDPAAKSTGRAFIRGPPTTRHEFPRRPTRRRPRGAARRA